MYWMGDSVTLLVLHTIFNVSTHLFAFDANPLDKLAMLAQCEKVCSLAIEIDVRKLPKLLDDVIVVPRRAQAHPSSSFPRCRRTMLGRSAILGTFH